MKIHNIQNRSWRKRNPASSREKGKKNTIDNDRYRRAHRPDLPNLTLLHSGFSATSFRFGQMTAQKGFKESVTVLAPAPAGPSLLELAPLLGLNDPTSDSVPVDNNDADTGDADAETDPDPDPADDGTPPLRSAARSCNRATATNPALINAEAAVSGKWWTYTNISTWSDTKTPTRPRVKMMMLMQTRTAFASR